MLQGFRDLWGMEGGSEEGPNGITLYLGASKINLNIGCFFSLSKVILFIKGLSLPKMLKAGSHFFTEDRPF